MAAAVAPIGLIVNPRAGTDVRRAVAAAATVTVEVKANAVRRVVLGARESGANRFVVHRDPHDIVRRATETIRGLDLVWVDEPMRFSEEDTVSAVAAMRSMGCAVVVVLGGDGTNVAGSAAGHLATGLCSPDDTATSSKVVRLVIHDPDDPGGSHPDLALVDVVAVDDPYVGSFELFDPHTLRLAGLTRCSGSDHRLSARPL